MPYDTGRPKISIGVKRMNYQAPQIEWKTEQETETDGFCSYETNTATHKYRIYHSDVMKSWMCTYYRFSKPETKHKYLPTAQELKEWVEQTHYPSALIKVGFKPVSEPLSDTLIEKLEQARDNHNYYLETCSNDRDKAYHSFGKKCYQEAINIVKQHSEWIPVSEEIPVLEVECGFRSFEPTNFYQIIDNEGCLHNAYFSTNHYANDDRALFTLCELSLYNGKWLVDDEYEVITVNMVKFWKPLSPPGEVQDD